MTSERAREVYQQYLNSPLLQPCIMDFLTKDEIEYVTEVWEKMPGHTSFRDAFLRIVKLEDLGIQH